MYVDEERLESFMQEVPIMQKAVHLFAEQLNDLVSIQQEELMLCSFHVFIEINSLIMTN